MMHKAGLFLAFLIGNLIGNAQTDLSLLTPFNADTIETSNPFLGWSDLASGGRFHYELIIVEMQEGQTPAEAIQMNTAVYRSTEEEQNGKMYPFDAPQLKPGVWYAWVVNKMDQNILVSSSESWKFIITPEEEKVQPTYARLKVRPDGVPYLAKNGKVYFTYDEPYQPGTLQFQWIDESGKQDPQNIYVMGSDDQRTGTLNMKSRGSNYFELDLGSTAKQGNYLLRVTDTKGRTQVLPVKVN